MSYRLGDRFPHEGFVQRSLERHFGGWESDRPGTVDLRFSEPDTGVMWVIEAKGSTKNAAVDFRAGLGQLMSQMGDGPGTNYVLAMPDIEEFTVECQKIPQWVRQALNLYWFLIDEEGGINAVPPHLDVRTRG